MKSKLKKLIAFFRDWDKQSGYLKWIISYTRPFVPSLLLILFLDFMISLTGIGSTVVVKYIIDGATGAGGQFTAWGIAAMILLTLVSIAVSAASGILATFINEKFAFSIRTGVYGGVLRSSWQKLIKYHSGDIITRLTSDVDSVANGVSSIVPGVIFLVVRLAIAFSVLFYYDPFLAVTALFLGPAGVLCSLAFGGLLKKFQEELKDVESVYRSFMQESVSNITIIKSFEQEGGFVRMLSDIRDKRLKIMIKRNKVSTVMNLCMRLVFNLGYFVAFGWGIYRLSVGSITYGTMTVFLSLVSQVQGPIMGLGSIIPQLINVLTSAGRIIEIDTLDAEEDTAGPLLPDGGAIGLRLDGVTFAYGGEPVLEDVCADIKPGETVGIIGRSGSGKTTLARLILALVKPQAGTVTLCGADGCTEEISAAARRFITYVPQGNTLISGTIADNLRMGRADADENELWRALWIADADTFVRESEHGLDMRVGENKTGLSEGQAQRVAIARAVIRRAPILILDEATSALDVETERRIIERLAGCATERTCFIITHRYSMLRYCDRVFKIADRRLREIDPKSEGAAGRRRYLRAVR